MAAVFPASQAIVVGGGLAGVSAANTILELGGKCILLDKSSFCGGNSTKATSGINGANTRSQRMKGVFDSNETFTADTLRGGAKKPEIVKVLCENSGPDVEWLMDNFALDLSLVARLGGHSQPRTHRGAERFPGMTITYALIQMLEKVAENSDRAKIICKARVYKLLTNSAGSVVGCEYEFGGKAMQEHGPVILASGGFGADFTSSGLLAQYRPDLLHLPTTNGEHCTGDGIKMGEAIGASTIDLEWVQVHPTGLVKPDDADAKVKFLAAEALRGVGGILLDNRGERFANELGRRDYVTGEMWKNRPPFRLCLNSKASNEIHWHCEHYKGRGVMRVYSSGEELAKDAGFPYETMVKTLSTYNQIAAKMVAGEPGAPYDAYGGGKSWDPWGKKYFHNTPVEPTDSFHVAIVTPVIHYCMGGLEIDAHSRVVKGNKAIDGLYAAGEIAGGVHGNNRLGGNSLLDCVVFGRVSGRHCAEYMMGTTVPTSLAELSGALAAGGAEAPAAAAVAAPAAAATNKTPLLGKGKDDAKVWGDYPHNTTINIFTAGWMMVVAFLKEICFTIFTTLPIKVEGGRKEFVQDLVKFVFAIMFVFFGYKYFTVDGPVMHDQ
jgi:flavocytochrome c